MDYLKLDSCGGYEKNYTADPVGRQYANYAAMRDALNATGRPIYYSICEINGVIESDAVKNSPSACGHTSAYTSLPWHAQPDKYPVPDLANSVLIEWVNNNNNFCVAGSPRSSALSLQNCKAGDSTQQFTMEADGSIRHQGHSGQCLDVYNCQKTDGAPTRSAAWRSPQISILGLTGLLIGQARLSMSTLAIPMELRSVATRTSSMRRALQTVTRSSKTSTLVAVSRPARRRSAPASQ